MSVIRMSAFVLSILPRTSRGPSSGGYSPHGNDRVTDAVLYIAAGPPGSTLVFRSHNRYYTQRYRFSDTTYNMGRLAGKVAIVTGAGSGFGEAMAHAFVAEGAHVLIADIAVDNANRVVEDIMNKKSDSQTEGSAIFVPLNVTNRSQWTEALAVAVSRFGKLDIVVNNAGTTYKKQPSVDVSEEDFDRIVAVNIKSIYLSVSVVMPYFMEQKKGVFLNTSSVAGTRVRPGQVFYGGTKGFLNTVIPPLSLSLSLIWFRTSLIVSSCTGNARTGGRVRPPWCSRQFDLSSSWRHGLARDVQRRA